MKLEHAVLENVCQHKRTELFFKPGITGILGSNGSGKSNHLNMIKASLTGDFSVNPGVKDDNIRWGTPEGGKSAVMTTWSHDGSRFHITRGLKNQANILRIDGRKEEFRRANEITEQVEG